MNDDTACPVACENCDGNGGFKVDSMTLYGIPGGEDWGEMCPVCKGTGTVNTEGPTL